MVEFPGISYQLVDGEGSKDNAFFTISENKLKTAIGFNFETKPSHSIRIKATDSAGLSFEKSLSVTVTDANDTPIGITIDNNKIEENTKKGATIGNLSAIDEDAGDRHTFSLVVPQDGGVPPFSISGTTLKTTAELDFEAQSRHDLLIRVVDDKGAEFSQMLTIDVLNASDPPTAVILSPAQVQEGQPKDTLVGTLTASDPDQDDTHTFRITGGTDKSLFAISGSQLFTKVPLDYESKSELQVTIEARDSENLTVEQALIVNVIDVNDPPSDIALGNDSLPENESIGTLVGKLSLVDDASLSTNSGSGNRFVPNAATLR